VDNRRKRNVSEEKKPSFVPPVVAAVLSALLPGLGQILARSLRKGLLLIVSFYSIIGLVVWRIYVATQLVNRDATFLEKIPRAMRLEPVLVVITILFVILYFLIIYDAYHSARDIHAGGSGVLFLLAVIFFVLGWQIGQIDLYAMFSQMGDAGPALSRVLWPWERALTYPEETQTAVVEILSPCTDTPFPEAELVEGIPSLKVNPTCGEPSESAELPGTSLTLEGSGFTPGTPVDIWWRDPIGNEFRQRQAGEYVAVTPDETGSFEVEIIFPYRLLPHEGSEVSNVWEIEGRQVSGVGKAQISMELQQSIEKIIETIFIGMMATFFGILMAVPISFLAARNLMSASPVTVAIYFIVRTILIIIRSIEPLIWAIIAVIVVGLGPVAGILALPLHSIAALAKLYSEAIESIDPGPIEAIQATGANGVQTVVFAVIPQVIPPFVSFTIYRWDINIRMSTIIGFVGGGGIGFLLSQWIRLLDYRAAGMAVWFIAITVAILDYVSAEIRARFI